MIDLLISKFTYITFRFYIILILFLTYIIFCLYHIIYFTREILSQRLVYLNAINKYFSNKKRSNSKAVA